MASSAQTTPPVLKQMPPMSAEASVVRNYLDWLLSVPWGKAKQKPIDLARAEGAGVAGGDRRNNRDAIGLEQRDDLDRIEPLALLR